MTVYDKATRRIITKTRARRRAARGAFPKSDPLSPSRDPVTNDTTGAHFVAVYDVESRKEKEYGKPRTAKIGHRSTFYNPAHDVAQEIRDALDVTKAPSKVRSFKDMTPEEQAVMRRLYERK